MSKKANPTLIGGFVVGAVALVVGALLIFGSGGLLARKNKFVMYFSSSIAGLQVGSPVSFRGVKIGSITDIRVEYNVSDASVRTPVFIEIEPRRITETGSPSEVARYDTTPVQTMELLVQQGLRAQLRMVSMVTGQMAVEFDFHPGTPIRLVGGEADYPELPTVPSTMEQITSTLSDLPIEEMVESFLSAVRSLERVLAELQPIPRQLDGTLVEVQRLAGSLINTSGTANDVLRDSSAQLGSLAAELELTSQAVRETMGHADATLGAVAGATAGTSELQYELASTLRELSSAARALRVLAESLEEHPERLLRGRANP